MARIYIDFDSTLYNTEKIRNLDNLIADLLKENSHLNHDEAKNAIEKCSCELENSSPFDLCECLEKKYNLQPSSLRVGVEKFLAGGKCFVFDDSFKFLKRMSQKGHEINILTYTSKKFEYQMFKLIGADILSFVDNVMICSKHKGDLNLDYEYGFFIDDNPDEIKSLSSAGVNKERLFRMKREGMIYSSIKIEKDICIEVENFDEINCL